MPGFDDYKNRRKQLNPQGENINGGLQDNLAELEANPFANPLQIYEQKEKIMQHRINAMVAAAYTKARDL